MNIVAYNNSGHVALWFHHQIMQHENHAQPGKIHALLYFTQGSYAALNHGALCMPITFLIQSSMVAAADIDIILQYAEKNNQKAHALPGSIEHFLTRIWARYGNLSAMYLHRKIEQQPHIIEAMKHGEHTIIDTEKIIDFFAADKRDTYQYMKTNDGRILPKWVPSGIQDIP